MVVSDAHLQAGNGCACGINIKAAEPHCKAEAGGGSLFALCMALPVCA